MTASSRPIPRHRLRPEGGGQGIPHARLAGIDIVVFEEVLLDGEVIAEHADILDADQTVAVEAAPEIGTVATDAADGDHEAQADDDVTIVDEVRYRTSSPGASTP